MVKSINGIIVNDYIIDFSHPDSIKHYKYFLNQKTKIIIGTTNFNEEQEEYLLMIKNANERLLGLTNNILLLNKIDNREIVSICPFTLDNQIREAVILLESKWKEKNLNINIELDEFLIE